MLHKTKGAVSNVHFDTAPFKVISKMQGIEDEGDRSVVP